MTFEPIENYGVIGNMQSIALVGMNGSIDFLCYPDFDSPTVFAALLEKLLGYANHLGLYSEELGGQWPASWQLSPGIHASRAD